MSAPDSAVTLLCPGSRQTLIPTMVEGDFAWCRDCREVVEVERGDSGTVWFTEHTVSRSLTEAERLAAEHGRLRGLYRWLRHDISCAVAVRALPESDRCTCGLAEAWAGAEVTGGDRDG